MRYALRNKSKIQKVYGNKGLEIILKSLNSEYGKKDQDIEILKGEKYPVIMINNIQEPVKEISFYLLETKFDVHRLALKKFIS